MPHRTSPLTRHLLASALPAVLLVLTPATSGRAEPLIGTTMNRYGLPGLIDTPTAEMLPDASIGATLAYAGVGNRTGLTFQALPQVTVALRYGRFDSLEQKRGYVRDRSLDFRLQLLGESEHGWMPAVAVGIQDAIGTGFYSSEYIVATKSLTPRLRVSAGLGWGRLAQSGGVGSPFGDRPGPDKGEGGSLNAEQWFRGEMAPFAGIQWKATDKLTLAAEYSGDDYACETGDADRCGRTAWVSDKSPLKNHVNLGFTYQAGRSYQIGGYVLGGQHFGLQASMLLNPRQSAVPSGTEKAGAPVRPRPLPGADPEGWSGAWAADPTAQPAIQAALAKALAKEGQQLQGMVLTARRAEVRIDNNRYNQQAEAVGRTARLMTRALPPSVETLVITSMERGMPTSSVTLRRSDVERLENTEAGRIAAVAVLSDADPRPAGLVPGASSEPRFQWSLKPYLSTGLFDPDQPFRYEVGGALSASYEVLPGLVARGTVRQRLFGNAKQEGPGDYTADEYAALDRDQIEAGNHGVYRVRSDGRMYSGNDKPTVPVLSLTWYARPTDQIYTRVSVGLLERMYGGVSAEALWKPVNSPLGLGVEVNRVKKRDFEDAFGFRDYEVTTGHVSAYYEFGDGFVGQLDVGRYLAGDKGATLSLKRTFANGWEVGAYATKTDLSAEEFGEGSFDKGITLKVPLTWAVGTPSQRSFGGTLASLNRDGGQRLNVDGRLYDTIRPTHATSMYDGWGRFWR